MNEDKIREEQKSVENLFDKLIEECEFQSYSVGTVIEILLKKIVDLTFKFTTSHQDALDMIAEQTTDAMIDNHDERKTH